jgi:sodium transport system permease protein
MLAAFSTYMMDVKGASTALFNIPIVNMSLIIKEFISGIYNPLHISITFAWMIAYTAVSILFARFMFSKEEVIFRT